MAFTKVNPVSSNQGVAPVPPKQAFQIPTMNLIFLVFLCFYIGNTSPIDQYYVNGESGQSDQQFFYNYQPRSVYYYPNEINKPIFHPELGMSPQYHNVVYNYLKDFAGTEPPVHVNTFQPNFIHNTNQFVPQNNGPANVGIINGDKIPTQTDHKEVINNGGVKDIVTDKPGLNDYFLPSDAFALNNHPNSQFYGHLDAIKTKRMNLKARPTSLPPIGGVVSNYVLLRGHQNPNNLLQLPGTVKEAEVNQQHIKRQIPDDSEGVVILAEPPQNAKMSEENEQMKNEPEENKEEEDKEMEAHPGIAQSKPSAIALAGPGGVAQASPVGTALVGQGGLAVAAPSGTAVAGPAGQGALPIQIGNEKQKTTEKSEESDAY